MNRNEYLAKLNPINTRIVACSIMEFMGLFAGGIGLLEKNPAATALGGLGYVVAKYARHRNDQQAHELTTHFVLDERGREKESQLAQK